MGNDRRRRHRRELRLALGPSQNYQQIPDPGNERNRYWDVRTPYRRLGCPHSQESQPLGVGTVTAYFTLSLTVARKRLSKALSNTPAMLLPLRSRAGSIAAHLIAWLHPPIQRMSRLGSS
jgi:hypothetical protein